jgi:hypothetical protein
VLSPPRATPVAGRPLVNLSFALNYALGGLDVRGYHLFNVGIHLLAALILFGIVRRTLGLPTARGESPAAFGRRCIATLGATPDLHHGLLWLW